MSAPSPGMLIGARIRAERRSRHLTKAALARAAGLSRGYLTRLEAGEFQEPRLSTLTRIAGVLGMRPEELRGEGEAMTNYLEALEAAKAYWLRELSRFPPETLATLYSVGEVLERQPPTAPPDTPVQLSSPALPALPALGLRGIEPDRARGSRVPRESGSSTAPGPARTPRSGRGGRAGSRHAACRPHGSSGGDSGNRLPWTAGGARARRARVQGLGAPPAA